MRGGGTALWQNIVKARNLGDRGRNLWMEPEVLIVDEVTSDSSKIKLAEITFYIDI